MTKKQVVAYISVNKALLTPYVITTGVPLDYYFKEGNEFGYRVFQYVNNDGGHKYCTYKIECLNARETAFNTLKGKKMYHHLPVFHDLDELREFTGNKLDYDEGRIGRLSRFFSGESTDTPEFQRTFDEVTDELESHGISPEVSGHYIIQLLGICMLGGAFSVSGITKLA